MNNKEQKKIKVLFVQEPAGGGSLISLYELLKALECEEIEMVAVCYYKNKYTQQLEHICNCKVIYVEDTVRLENNSSVKFSTNRFLNIFLIQYNSIRKYFDYDKKIVGYFIDVFQKERPDIVHHNNDIAVNRSSIRAGIKLDIPQILYNHFLPGYKYNFVDRIVDSILYRKISYHIHLTKAIESHYKKVFHSSLSNSAILHSFVDRNVFKPYASCESTRREFGIEDDEIVITNTGRITAWKGQHILIEALNKIKNDLPKFKVLMVGSYEKGVGSYDYYSELKKMACGYHLHDRIIFTGNRTDIADIINASDVLVHTAVKPEPQGIVILEGLLCKKTVVASDDAGSAELIQKYGGILFEPGNATELGEILLKLFQNKTLAIKKSYPYNYEKLDADFNSLRKAKRIIDIYKGCLRKCNP